MNKSNRPRKSQSTIADRQAIYEQVVEESMEWHSLTIEQVAEKLQVFYQFKIITEGRAKEQLIRSLFLQHMKRMIS